jgi:chromosome segregation ATPase
MQQMDQRLRDLNSERARVESESARADADVRNVQSRLDAAAKQTRAIASNDVVLAHFGENFDPLRHGAKEDLLRKQADAFQSVLTFQLDHALISRNQQGIEKYQVLPPVRDVELVLDRLRDAGIEASTGLRYLSETHNCEEAENLIRHDPGKYAGVFVGAKDWPRVPTLAWPEVTQPIEVSLFPHGTECQNGFKSHVVVPSRPAFDKPEASRRSLRLEDELTSTKRQLEAKRAEYHALGEVLTLLTTFLEQYGDGRLVVIERELRERVRHAEGLRSRSEELANDIAEVERQRTSTRAAELSSPERLNSQIQPGPSIVFRHS